MAGESPAGRSFRIIPLICASLTIALGLLTFIGWISGLDREGHRTVHELHSFPTRRSADLDGRRITRRPKFPDYSVNLRIAHDCAGPAHFYRLDLGARSGGAPYCTRATLFPYTTLCRSRWPENHPQAEVSGLFR